LSDFSPAAVFVLYTSIKLPFRVILYELTVTASELHSEGIVKLGLSFSSLTLPVTISHTRAVPLSKSLAGTKGVPASLNSTCVKAI